MPAQLAAKQQIVRDAFARIAKRHVELPPIESSPQSWEYRSRLTLAMRRRHGEWVMGLHAYDDVDGVFDLRECPITDPRVVSAWAEVRRGARLLPRSAELRGTVRLAGTELSLVLEGGDAWPSARDFAGAVPSMSVIRWRPSNGGSRIVVDRRGSHTPDESFDQVNQPVATAARRELLERALAASPRTAIDAYAGLGATSRALADRGVSVTAIEADASAARFAAGHLPPESRVLTGLVEDFIAQCLPADVVVLNPPRAGVHARVTEALDAQPRPRRVLYMSCDPATLARDVARLPAYRVSSLRAYDMFPQTAHVEVVCELSPEEA
jgi:23S rRNA (uracil1939-C5)-methyltransferase